jgi:hypothetical protein
MRRFWLICLLASMLATARVAAQPQAVSDADMRTARAVVQAQLDAFAADDAPRAFSFAAPGLRAAFGNADRFMAMVRMSYPVVYRPASVAFLVPEWHDRELIQGVHFTDGQGWPLAGNLPASAPARQQLAHQRLRARRESVAHDLRRHVPTRSKLAADAASPVPTAGISRSAQWRRRCS